MYLKLWLVALINGREEPPGPAMAKLNVDNTLYLMLHEVLLKFLLPIVLSYEKNALARAKKIS